MRRVTREICAIYRIDSVKRSRISDEARTEVERRSPSKSANCEDEARVN